ncbi:hypothetical protein UlMin_008474 [Ulmus minor]
MRVNGQEVTFNIFDALNYPDEGSEECSFVKTIDSLVQKQIRREQDNFKEELAQFEDGKLLEEEKLELIKEKQAIPQWTKRYESLELTSENFKENVPSIEKPLVLELKQLPSHLKYVYLGDNETLPVIISSYLTPPQEENLIVTLKRHKKAIGWQIADIKGISPTLCMHKILLEDNSKNSIEGQRRLNPIMKEVVKKEIIKWLDARIIYPISDSVWVSPVQCVPKKGGVTTIAIAPEDQEKTTFTCPYKMEIFMDDFSIFGESFQSCLVNLEKVLDWCEKTNLVLNWEKCHFMVQEGIVLGHKVSKKGIEVDKAKIEDFSKISKPLCQLLEHNRTFEFDEACLKAFETLRNALVSTPIIIALDWEKPFELMCDASDFVVGAMLGQR